MNILFCSVGRRGELLKDFRLSMEPGSKIVAADNSRFAPALYFADKTYLVPLINDPGYVDLLLDICKKEKIDAVTTLIDPEIRILAENRGRFAGIGVEVLAPYTKTADLCFDKYEMYKYCVREGVRTVRTWGSLDDALAAVKAGELSYPLFVKPRTGSGSVGARKVISEAELRAAFLEDPGLIAQELMTGEGAFDLDADCYIDTVSKKSVAIFTKRKISTTLGGANKTISFKDQKLFDFLSEALTHFEFNGPIDVDVFYKNGEYYLSEVNPRFGGAYLHAYGAGVDFIRLIEKNVRGEANESIIGQYEEDVVMLMYDSVVIKKLSEMPE